MTITPELILGAVGTLTGGVSLWVSWRQWRADRSELRIEATISFSQSIALPDDHLSLRLTLKNHGRRLIKITDIGIVVAENEWQMHNGSRVFLQCGRLRPANLHPQKLNLQEGDRHDFDLDPFDLAYVAHARRDRRRRLIFYAIDSLDREYRTTVKIPDEKHIKSLEETNETKTTKAANTRA